MNLGMINDDFVHIPRFEDMIYMNHNARCFMAIEIENFVSHKHIMGGAIKCISTGQNWCGYAMVSRETKIICAFC